MIAIVMGAALASPATALAENCAPPGTSGVVQYLETIPGASCNAPFPGGAGHGGHGSAGGGLTTATARALQAQGSAGVAVERLVAATGTAGQLARKGSGAGGRVDRGASALGGNAATHAESLPSALLGPVAPGDSADGSGLLVPMFVATALLLAVGTTIAARRHARRSK